MTTSISRPAARLSARDQSGAFDLPSILIGVAVVAILAIGVMATIFGVIPWAQDRAAKQDLAAMNTAQGTMYARDGSFADKAALVGAGWLGEGTPEALDAKADVEGKCYVAVTTSKTGNQFVISHDKPAPRELTTSDTWCNGVAIIKDTSPVMVTTWDTGLAPNCQEITLPIHTLKGTVTWGDGAKGTELTHAYAASGEVQIRVDGTFSWWGGVMWDDSNCLLSVDRWGATGTTKLYGAFQRAHNLKHVESIPSTTTDLSFAFEYNKSNFTLGHLDTSNVTSMRGMFQGAEAFDQPVNFDTSNVTSMGSMFQGAAAFDQPVNFDTSNVTDMSGMFWDAKKFNQPLNFDTSNVTTMQVMFGNADTFNQPVNFNTPKLTTVHQMFSGAKVFNQPVNLSDTSETASMYAMFHGTEAFNQPLNFNVSKVTNMDYMFHDAKSFNQPLDFNTSNVTSMNSMFYDAHAFNQDLSAWNVSKVDDRASFNNTAAWTLPKPIWKD